MFKQASRLKLRFHTEKGALSTEQLWDLPLTVLDRLALDLENKYKESGKKSFLVSKSRKDKELKLMFDIVLDILTTKVDENKTAREAASVKEHNEKILALIAEKENEELKSASLDDLKSMLR